VTTSGARTGVLVMAHGTPARIEEVGSFYTEIRRGRPPSDEQLADLERRYRVIGGTSPLNAITLSQARGLSRALEQRHPGLFAVRMGTRFAAPRIEEAAHALIHDDEVDRVVGLVLAPHSSRASVAHYEQRARAATEGAGNRARPLYMVDHWYDAPGFDALVAIRLRSALDDLDDDAGRRVLVVFSAHSVPAALVAAGDTYAEQVETSARAAAEAAGVERWALAWQSAGRTDDEWLGPDVRAVIADAPAGGATAVVVCPIGFVADHLEVLYDVDVEAMETARSAGIAFARTASFNADEDFCALLAAVVVAGAGVEAV